MTLEEWIFQAARIKSIWGRELEKETVVEWFESLRSLSADAVLRAINDLRDDPEIRSLPKVALIRRRALDFEPRKQEPCVCFDAVNAFRHCKAGHPEGWKERREVEEQARAIIDKAPNGEVDPNRFPGELRVAISAWQLRDFYDKNLAEGRAADDPGDEHGCPTRGKDAKCIMEAV